MKIDQALIIADEWLRLLSPLCYQIQVAGSVRRGKDDVKDIEFVLMPNMMPVPRAPLEFGKPIPPVYKTALDAMIAKMHEDNQIIIEQFGDRKKKFFLPEHKINMELYIVLPPATWGVQLVIRTGTSDFSHWIVTRKRRGGSLPNGYRVQDGAVWEGENEVKDLSTQTLIGFESEIDFLEWLGLDWIEPGAREARWKP